jgi:hypothetical protein
MVTRSEDEPPANDAARRPERGRYDIEESWPDDVWSIGLERIDLLGVDEKGRLYWNGHPVEMKRRLSLSRWQTFGAIAVTLATICAAIGTCISAYADLKSLPTAPPPRSSTHRSK